MELHNIIIYILGIPAVGKYTVAKEIGRMTGAKVVDNQLINLPVFSVVGYDGTDTFPFPQGAWAHIETIRSAVLTVIAEECSLGDSFIFTNVLDANVPEDKVLFERIAGIAQSRDADFFPIWLTCEAEMLRQRKNTPDRRARQKDSDISNIEWYLQTFEILKVDHPNALTLDTSHYNPEQTALRVLEHVQRIKNN